MSKKRVLMIGVSTGVGFMAAEKLLQEHNCEVYAAAPDIEPMRSLEALGATLIEIDVTSSESVNNAITQVIEQAGGIDVVHFNAGLNIAGAIEAVPEEMVERIYQVNVFGLARVIRAVTPQLRKQRAGRFIVTGSVISHFTARMMGWYSSTKHALYAIMTAFRQEVSEFGIEVVVIEPGQINTGFDQAAMARVEAMGHPEDYTHHVDEYINMNTALLTKAQDGTTTAAAMVKAITDSTQPKPVIRTTADAVYVPLIKRLLGVKGFDRMMIKAYRKYRK
ncbi:hypothetical protein R50073_31250 [Maricurvus nonylphenolicus]|uniref:SDR family NAD(P)-dependent oxidoreductase n=1 Tax=Maricurvus nonylphenolicus TaxID=1008307 RepID=UPI0036F3E046